MYRKCVPPSTVSRCCQRWTCASIAVVTNIQIFRCLSACSNSWKWDPGRNWRMLYFNLDSTEAICEDVLDQQNRRKASS